MNERKLLLAILITATSCLLTLSLLQPTFSRPVKTNSARNYGSIKSVGVGVYSDPRCTLTLNSINWGELEPGASKNLTCYIRDEGKNPVLLSLYETNWNPSNASQFVTLQWDYGDSSINPNQVAKITLILTLSANAPIGLSFTFDSIITSSG